MDLRELVATLRVESPKSDAFNGCYLTAIGGLPLSCWPDGFNLRTALGESALLTKMNPQYKTRQELGDLLVRLDHDWACHWVMATLTFVGYPESVHWAFAHDKRFWISWSDTDKRIWSATGGLKEWRKYLKNQNSEDFPEEVRSAFVDAHKAIREIDTEYFNN